MPEIKDKAAVYDLAFGVHVHPKNMFSAKIMKLKDGRVSEWKHGEETSMGHALTIAESLMGSYVVQAIEKTAQQFYDEVKII